LIQIDLPEHRGADLDHRPAQVRFGSKAEELILSTTSPLIRR
jgi:hypothetical protein